jgi:outer membrane murein-binding lipoprotein Lpp
MSLALDERIEQEMKKYEIKTFADIVKALIDHPDWLEELRKIILTSELLELPKKMEEVLQRLRTLEEKHDRLEKKVDKIESDVEILKQDVAVLKQDVAVLKQDVEGLKKDVEGLKKDMNYLKGEFGKFKGSDLERKVRDKFAAYFGRILKRSKLVDLNRLIYEIDEAEENGIITQVERDSLLDLDLVVGGELKESRKPVYLAVEVSYSLYEDDIKRSLDRANVLYKVLNQEVIPTVVYVEGSDDIEEFAKQNGVLAIKVNY